jgi:hypothetical protein
VGRLPAEYLSRHLTRDHVVGRDERAEEGEVLGVDPWATGSEVGLGDRPSGDAHEGEHQGGGTRDQRLAALDVAVAFFEEVREFAGPRHRIIASRPELQERELIKLAAVANALARALRARGIGDTAADLAARTGTTVMQVAFAQWVDDADHAPFRQFVRDALAQLRELAATG